MKYEEKYCLTHDDYFLSCLPDVKLYFAKDREEKFKKLLEDGKTISDLREKFAKDPEKYYPKVFVPSGAIWN